MVCFGSAFYLFLNNASSNINTSSSDFEENESSVESDNIEAITPFDDLLNGECSAERLYLDIYAPERLNFCLKDGFLSLKTQSPNLLD